MVSALENSLLKGFFEGIPNVRFFLFQHQAQGINERLAAAGIGANIFQEIDELPLTRLHVSSEQVPALYEGLLVWLYYLTKDELKAA